MLTAAGLTVLWLDNQPGGCEDVCDRVPNADARVKLEAAAQAALCSDDGCLDNALLVGLDRRIEALAPECRAKGVLLLMHQMSSHGPANHKRSSADIKRFVPECRINLLADCSHGELINAYDNSIAYTDRFLGRPIDWLKTQSPCYADHDGRETHNHERLERSRRAACISGPVRPHVSPPGCAAATSLPVLQGLDACVRRAVRAHRYPARD
ncbi:MAG: hypothetical protein EOP02_00300 [Proteobacteria bacterium]|jgi:glucan phosphoethanolaminetransferase (alkaline phosphatase superfamily)|nr:MAG: hypothetical protein EOP02_00300 [Pseudomonadota bacterium]